MLSRGTAPSAGSSSPSVRIAKGSGVSLSSLRQAGARGARAAASSTSAAVSAVSTRCRAADAYGLLLFLLGATLSAVFFHSSAREQRAAPDNISRKGHDNNNNNCGAGGAPRPLSVAAFADRAHWNEKNPFLVAAGWSVADFSGAASALGAFRGSLAEQVLGAKWRAAQHARFDASPAARPCAPLSRLGGSAGSDGGKWVCGAAALVPGCVIYSLGSNNEWDFEAAALTQTPCDVFTFDCTSGPPPAGGPLASNARLHFEKVCLGDGGGAGGEYRTLREIAAAHGHTAISLLKVDIEGYEFGVVESLWRGALLGGSAADLALLPAQLTVEVHDATIMPGLAWNCAQECARTPPPYGDGVTLSPGDMLPLWVQLSDLGYVVVSREDNAMCTECVEFTLVRAFS